MKITKVAVNLLAGLVSAAAGCAGAAHAETPYSYCLKTDGVPYDSDPDMYISVGEKVLTHEQHGDLFMQVVEELEKEGAPPNVAAAIAACAPKVNCTDLLDCAP
jgi:hypothetical protein